MCAIFARCIPVSRGVVGDAPDSPQPPRGLAAAWHGGALAKGIPFQHNVCFFDQEEKKGDPG